MLRSLVGSEMCIRDSHQRMLAHRLLTKRIEPLPDHRPQQPQHLPSRQHPDDPEILQHQVEDCHAVHFYPWRRTVHYVVILQDLGSNGRVVVQPQDAIAIRRLGVEYFPSSLADAELYDPIHRLSRGVKRGLMGPAAFSEREHAGRLIGEVGCLLYTSDAADEEDSVDLGGRRII
eukprot:TRINITY_DN24584_c0_g1_i3.p1 TRINITY_DN24584_c0_g1~~TRINITY_DN24584_c0_g1_i3.p1  ORF type:complete len:198 (-),score=36.81 TRINITY_DN24584_c0_g1_i3:66-590(-)